MVGLGELLTQRPQVQGQELYLRQNIGISPYDFHELIAELKVCFLTDDLVFDRFKSISYEINIKDFKLDSN